MNEQPDPWERLQEAYAEYVLNYGRAECEIVAESYLGKVRGAVAEIVATRIAEELFKDDRPWYRQFEVKHHA
jgi:hypothetical protein